MQVILYGGKDKFAIESKTLGVTREYKIDFEGVEVSGELVKPQGSLLLERKRAQFNSMIKLRTDFDDEMDKSVDEIK